ncbi:MAG: MarR family transcriptional regulator [Acidimicrobiaceae bacterium]|nr:MarR family transcriptional regulator [Acidimicrobiaceae bacterium]
MTSAPRIPDVASEVWSSLVEVVVNNDRKREVCEQTGLSLGKVKALRRIAECPLSMGELATLLGVDPPNMTTMIDDMQHARLVQRQVHPTDRRIMLVAITATGSKLARKANDILSRVPESLLVLPVQDLEQLRRILARVR